MMADFLAHMAYVKDREGTVDPNALPFLEREQLPPLPPGQSGVNHLQFAPGGLADLKQVLIEKMKARASAKRPVSPEQSS
jgi:hypothetical protein